jgi:hypothetical protein
MEMDSIWTGVAIGALFGAGLLFYLRVVPKIFDWAQGRSN